MKTGLKVRNRVRIITAFSPFYTRKRRMLRIVVASSLLRIGGVEQKD